MSRLSERIRAFAELGRISNLPTTLSNVLVGASAGAVSALETGPLPLEWPRIMAAWVAIACFYMAGMAMNDLFDASLDLVDRPRRPIPSGRVTRAQATAFMLVLFAIGLGVLALTGFGAFVSGVILAGLIIAYNYFHLAFAWSVTLLGLARGMVYVVAAAAVFWPTHWFQVELLAGVLAIYVAMFSLVARSETQSQADQRRWIVVFLPFVVAVPAVFIQPVNWTWTIIPLAAALAWVTHGVAKAFESPPRTKDAVLIWISGICLIDALFLTLLDRPVLAIVAGVCFVLTLLTQRRIAGT
jgi:heme O synthase-like polyprenyltransferase